jgi:hypothetical protein
VAAAKGAGVVKVTLFSIRGLSANSGVFLGYSPDQTVGYVLTAAHSALSGGQPGPEGAAVSMAWITFDPIKGSGFLMVHGDQALLHPQFHRSREMSVDENGDYVPPGAPLHDLAILTFPATAPVRARLARFGYRPATLIPFSPVEELEVREEAFIAGYGEYATADSPVMLDDGGILLGGWTYVTRTAWAGRDGYVAFLPAARKAPAHWAGEAGEANPVRFAAMARQTCLAPRSRRPFVVESHAEQALGGPGDSGGPLFLTTKAGRVLAGIFSGGRKERLLTAGGRKRTFHVQFWEPLQDSLIWIETVLAGRPGINQIVPYLRPEDEAEGAGAGTDQDEDEDGHVEGPGAGAAVATPAPEPETKGTPAADRKRKSPEGEATGPGMPYGAPGRGQPPLKKPKLTHTPAAEAPGPAADGR